MTEKFNSQLGDTPEMRIKKAFANLLGWIVEDKVEWRQPIPGDEIQIIEEGSYIDEKHRVIINDMPFLTVKEVNPVIENLEDGRHAWSYMVWVYEVPIGFRQHHYKITTPVQA